MTFYRLGLVCTLCTLGLAAPKAQTVAGYGNLPVHFERNQGQWEDGSLFGGITSGYRFSVDQQGFRLTLASGEILGFRMVGANAEAAYLPSPRSALCHDRVLSWWGYAVGVSVTLAIMRITWEIILGQRK